MSECTHGNMTAHGNVCPWCKNIELEEVILEAMKVYTARFDEVPNFQNKTATDIYKILAGTTNG